MTDASAQVTTTLRSCLEELAAQGKLVSADEPKWRWLIGMQYHKPAIEMLRLIESVGLADRPAKIIPARETRVNTIPAHILGIGPDVTCWLFEIEEVKKW